MNIRCLVVDDEPLAREGMELLIKEAGFLELITSCSSALEANQALTREEIDLMFLDIQMPKIRGIDFLRSLPSPPLTIITTAYPNFALEGFELNVLDYLVKPITLERFLKSVNRARDVLRERLPEQPPGAARLSASLAANLPFPDNYFFIRSNNGYEKIYYPEILFIEANQNYCTIHTTRQKFMTLTSMRSMEEQLPSGKFLRIHKSYIVAVDKIQSLTGNEVIVDKHKLPLSKNYKDDLMKIIDRRLIKK